MRIAVQSGTSKKVLRTTKLNMLLEDRFAGCLNNPEEFAPLCDHVRECMALATRAYYFPPQFDRTIAFSLVALQDILKSTVNTHLIKHNRWLNAGGLPPILIPYWIERMCRNGWCRKEASIACTQVQYCATMVLFLSKLEKKADGRNHVLCTSEECSNDVETPEAQHRHPDRGSALVSIERVWLNDILNCRVFPLLDFQFDKASDTLTIDLIESAGNRPYVAFSNVWAHGLGNPSDNAVRTCQLRELRDLGQRVFEASRLDGQEPDTSLLWLDTLCVPTERGISKAIAMGLMRKAFKDATHVLVLDGTLRSHNYQSTGYLDAAFRVYTSKWMRRLWCLQEGALPERLWFQFGDKCVKFQMIFEGLKSIYGTGDLLRASKALGLGALSNLFRRPEEVQPSCADVMRALQYRTVRVP